ncbi:hypothetical protein [Rubrivivax gelatinosus]|uniref:hypothetical protein n=1 Tax=Rubrivivax gelatinosus TaxID=28068 RepID=UPI000312823C|nr:hypothetical protein [Rubrivivax gelatinosus]MBG6083197.1 hypothetical protein [Rubrivivax gelatinosus]
MFSITKLPGRQLQLATGQVEGAIWWRPAHEWRDPANQSLKPGQVTVTAAQ